MSLIPTYPHDIFTDEALLDPHGHYQELRDLGPLVWLEAHQMYVVPRYTEARAVLADPASFCSGQGVALNEFFNGIGAGKNLIMTDGEQHEHLRGLMGQGLTPRALRSMTTAIELRAAELVATVVAQGRFDGVADLARVLPLTVVPDLIGWPAGGREHLLEWAGATFDLLGPLNERAEKALPRVQAMQEFAIQTAADGNLLPGSLGAALIAAGRRGELEPAAIPPLMIGYIAPSLDTTISAIGSAVWLLATHPDQWNRLKSDTSLVPNAFNETVRIESPIRAFSRVATCDTRIGECNIDAGSRLMILYASANRDERHFEHAHQFDIARSNAAEHIGFGYGTHGCAGQGLARLEAHAVLNALINQIESIELAASPVRGLNNLISSWASLPVVIRPRQAEAVNPS
jgi:cytochrome P450